MLAWWRESPQDAGERFYENVVTWFEDHGQTLDYVIHGCIGVMVCEGAARSKTAALA